MSLKNFDELKGEVKLHEELRDKMQEKGIIPKKPECVKVTLIFEGEDWSKVRALAYECYAVKFKKEENDPDKPGYVNVHRVMEDA